MIAVGKKMPSWVQAAYQDYAKRLPKEFSLTLSEVEAATRGKNKAISQLLAQEERGILAAIPPHSKIVSLVIAGKAWDTQTLAKQLDSWRQNYSQCCFIIGGPDGLSETCIRQSHEQWSLSPLTLPHPLVRVIVAEQLYRAYSLLVNHPYHK